MVMDAVAVAVALVLSSTCTVKLEVPCAVGIPEIAPVVGLIVRPAGSEPATTLQA